MALRTCKNGHLTGYRRCMTCGTKDVRETPGDGFVRVSKENIPRDENGRNELRELRAATRGPGGMARGQGAVAQRNRDYHVNPYTGVINDF